MNKTMNKKWYVLGEAEIKFMVKVFQKLIEKINQSEEREGSEDDFVYGVRYQGSLFEMIPSTESQEGSNFSCLLFKHQLGKGARHWLRVKREKDPFLLALKWSKINEQMSINFNWERLEGSFQGIINQIFQLCQESLPMPFKKHNRTFYSLGKEEALYLWDELEDISDGWPLPSFKNNVFELRGRIDDEDGLYVYGYLRCDDLRIEWVIESGHWFFEDVWANQRVLLEKLKEVLQKCEESIDYEGVIKTREDAFRSELEATKKERVLTRKGRYDLEVWLRMSEEEIEELYKEVVKERPELYPQEIKTRYGKEVLNP